MFISTAEWHFKFAIKRYHNTACRVFHLYMFWYLMPFIFFRCIVRVYLDRSVLISAGLCLYTYMYIVLIDYPTTWIYLCLLKVHHQKYLYNQYITRSYIHFSVSGLFWILVTFNLLIEYRIIITTDWRSNYAKVGKAQYTSSDRKELGITILIMLFRIY